VGVAGRQHRAVITFEFKITDLELEYLISMIALFTFYLYIDNNIKISFCICLLSAKTELFVQLVAILVSYDFAVVVTMDIGHLVTLLRGTLQPEERVDAEKQLIEVC